MSVKREEYLIIGVDVSDHYDGDDDYDKYERYYHNTEVGEFTLLVDGYSRNYTIFGEIMEYGNEYEGLPLTEINLDEFNEAIYRVRDKVRSLFGVTEQPRIYALTHWS
jgi:hypothetical protein